MAKLIKIDNLDFKNFFNRRPFQVSHTLADHRLFDLGELMLLANRLPAHSIEYNAGDIPISLDPARTPRTGLTVEETIKRIREYNSWMVIKNVEQDPAYKTLLETCLREIEITADMQHVAMSNEQGFIFISSPGAVTPFHIDPEHNFLFQVRGWKTITVFNPEDRNIVSDKDLESFYMGGHRNLVYKKEHASKGHQFRLYPGQGLHVPVTAPHWVQNGDEVSVSFSITFQSTEIDQRSYIYKVNAMLRKFGFAPVSPGISTLRDTVKIGMFNLLRKLKRLLTLPKTIWSRGSTFIGF